ncbi:hypothetical protein HU200_015233 [Digitaria exilis]|uniref:Sodium/calcium exchanger membrane region domain-containing protein n=1 Tax=Digitaria exilis TaxID=1010633 RepID=A0A835KM10_9POAL|nr:hypothetical protein HU200_015233 [Digitaria exilis]
MQLILLTKGRHPSFFPVIKDSTQRRRRSNASPYVLPVPENQLHAMTMCQQSYGFLPCATTVLGNLFLVITYGLLMYKGGTYLSHGSELLHEILGPGLVGGLLLPVLGALPEALIVLGPFVLMGMVLLAGSTVSLLTLLWGTCVVVGKCDLDGPDRVAVDLQNDRGFSLTGAGVSIDRETNYLARIMAISVVPFVIAGFPNVIKITHHGQRPAVLLAVIASFLLVVAYCWYQVSYPGVLKRRLDFVNYDVEAVLRKLFREIGMNGRDILSRAELFAFIFGIRINFAGTTDAAADCFMAEFDHYVDEEQFVWGMKRWIHKAKMSGSKGSGGNSLNFIHDYREKVEQDEAERKMEDPWFIAKAVGLMLLGTAMAALFADPLVDAVQSISNATRMPPFLISFVVLPLVTNSIGEPVSSLKCVSNKRQRSASLTFSELYSGVAMKNTLCLGVFLALIYVRDLRWEFSSEVLMVALVCVVVGLLASFRTTFPLWTCLVAYTMYPLFLVLVYVPDHVFHWS